MSFAKDELERVLRLQQQSYGLLKWLNGHLRAGTLSFNVVHGAVDSSAAAEEWLTRNIAHIPPELVPEQNERGRFAHLLVSYLMTSFELPAEKQNSRESNCGCYCDYCTYLVSIHRLVPRQPGPKDRRGAHVLKRLYLEQFTEALGYPLEPFLEEAIFSNKQLSLELSHATYAFQLLRRTEFGSQGCALLVLWRAIAWDEDGRKPKKNFELTAERILQAEEALRKALLSFIGAA